MKLPNFYDFEPLNQLKQRMGIPRDQYGSLFVEVQPPRLTPAILDQLATEGRDVSFGELEFLPNGTVAFGGVRVLVYIRDRSAFADMPKFHFASCATLVKMHAVQRIDRFVVATRMDGLFDMNLTGFGPVRKTQVRLRVCKNCLDKLQYRGYSHQLHSSAKEKMVNEFSIQEFFVKYPISLIETRPRYNSDNAPVNDYTRDWDEISSAYRESVMWKCENVKCKRVLAGTELRQYLHVHHRNGNKSDNRSDNLTALCIKCHAEQDGHSHMRASPHYSKFIALGL